MKPITVLSLFDGISCGQVALERAGIPIEVYYASEIDKYAIQVTQKNYPNTIQLGDITKIDFSKFIGKIDLLIGGSPCQDLSIAGARKGLSGERSGLFYKFVEALETIKPKYFLLENNVGMPQEAYEEISKLMGCYPIEINSSLVSAQNSKRYYWTNIGDKNYNLFGFPTCAIPQPKNKKIILKDVLEEICEPIIFQIPRGYNEGGLKRGKCHTLTTSRWQDNNLLLIPYSQKKYEEFAEEKGFIPEMFNPYNKQEIREKSPTLTTQCNTQTSSSTVLLFQPIRLQEYEKSKGQAQRVYSIKGKSVVLNANGGGQGGKTGLYKIDLPNGEYIIRKLTPVECERLQTLPDNYTEGISNSQRYKCIGNGWTVDVIAHIFKFLKEEL